MVLLEEMKDALSFWSLLAPHSLHV